MAAHESLVRLLNLYDYFWFQDQFFQKKSFTTFNYSDIDLVDTEFSHQHDQPKLARISTSAHADNKSTSSQESLTSGGGSDTTLLSPNSVLMNRLPVKLETICSGKEYGVEKNENKKLGHTNNNNTIRRRPRKGKGLSTKSLSELEFEELKGFMDLGFVFSEEDKNSRLAEIIPALQRFGKEEEDENIINSVAAASSKQPYLSQAWEDMEYRRKAAEKLKWKINADVDNEMDMKHQLKFWAHSVASAIK